MDTKEEKNEGTESDVKGDGKGTSRAGATVIDNRKTKKIVVISCLVIFIFVILITALSVINRINNNVYSNVHFEGKDLSGKSTAEVSKVVNDYAKEVYNKGVVIYNNKKTLFEVNAEDIGISINSSKTQESIINFARSGNIFLDNLNVLNALIFGKKFQVEYGYDKQKAAVIVDKIFAQIEGRVVDDTFTMKGDKLIITRGRAGLDIDREKVIEDLIQILLGRTSTAKSTHYDIATAKRQPKQLDVDVVYANVYKEAKDAKVDETKNPPIYESHENGVSFNKEELRKVLELDENKAEGKVIEFKLEITKPKVKLADLKWDKYSDLLGTFSTNFGTARYYANRNNNIKVAAQYLNGTVVMPGEVFSFNKTVGDCGLASRGFKMATVYSGGKVEQGMGGGVCQVSSTLYNTIIYANLEIVSRDNHGYTVSYVDCGRDATIYYPYLDLKFKNTRTYPIKIVAVYSDAGKLTMSIYGTKEENEYEVSIESYVLSRIPRGTTYVNDNTMNKGTQKTDTIGQDGFTSIAYKVLKKDGKVVEKKVLSNDTYSPMNNVVKVGTKPVNVSVYDE